MKKNASIALVMLPLMALNQLSFGSHLTKSCIKVNYTYASRLKQPGERMISGQVTDSETGEPLPGVTIMVKGTQTVTVTNGTGNFSIRVPDDHSVLTINFVGYIGLSLRMKLT